MKDYYCNDCEEGEQYTGNCYLSLPNIAGKPKTCPVGDEKEDCNWREM